MTRGLILPEPFGVTVVKQRKHVTLNRWICWLNRLLLRRLLSLSDAVLNDMGLTREDVVWACERPLCEDAAVQMRKRADARRSSQSRGRIR